MKDCANYELKESFYNLSIISVHAPTEEETDEEKEIFMKTYK
jgi:hypothetical protein